MHTEHSNEPMTYTAVPDSILGEFLVEFQDESLLRCFLRILWHLHRSKDKIKSVEIAVLDADPILDGVLSKRKTPDSSRLSTVLKEIYDLNFVLFAEPRKPQGDIRVLLNTRKNRTMIETLGWVSTEAVDVTRVLVAPLPESNIFGLYEQNIGLITPLVADELRDMETIYPVSWIEEAIQLSVIYNRKSIRYILGILERWRNEGRDGGPRRNSQTVGAKDYIRRYGLSGD
ncbi:MAG: hypothetical protein CL793_04825 [Chloroflexi bacterium]|nr:hypothetical protein [Chloroflexota bacterium]